MSSLRIIYGLPNMYRERGNSSTMEKIRIRLTVDMYHTVYESIKVKLLFLSSIQHPANTQSTSNTNLPLQFTPSNLHDKPQQPPPCTSR